MPARFSNVTGFVLIGGASRRMGKPKQHLILAGETQMSRTLRLLGSVCGRVAVLGQEPPISAAGPASLTRAVGPEGQKRPGGSEGETQLPFYEDVVPGRGPIAAIYTGLLRTRTEYNLFLSCDMPLLSAALLRLVCQHALTAQADVTVPESSDHHLQRLCAVYRRRVRGVIRAGLARGENKISGFYPHVLCEVIHWNKMSNAGFAANIFTNMNAPEDYLAVRRSLEENAGS